MASEAEQLRAAMAASLEQPNDAAEEERQLEQALRLSMMQSAGRHDDGSDDEIEFISSASKTSSSAPRSTSRGSTSTSPSIATKPAFGLTAQDQLRERAERMKRKSRASGEDDEDDGYLPDIKRPAFQEIRGSPVAAAPSKLQTFASFQSPLVPHASSSSIISRPAEPSSSSSTRSSAATMTFPNGGIRLTQTPGRSRSKNVISLPDLIDRDKLVSACIFSFFIAQDELFRHLPLAKNASGVPVYIGRDPGMDPYVPIACADAGIAIKGKISNKQLEQVKPALRKLYKSDYGQNFNAFYAWSSGSSHSKILVLVYPAFMRLVITSANMMNIDTVLGDNHWYIHDLPKKSKVSKSLPRGFEAELLAHLGALSVPDDFFDAIRGVYDYSSVKVSLVTSVPGTFSGAKAANHGLLRLRSVVKDLQLKLPKQATDGKLQLEVCAASIGNLSAKWLDGFYDCALGRKKLAVAEGNDEVDVPDLKIVYPCVQDVKRCYAEAQEAASNIGCHTRPWDKAPEGIQELFHKYRSKDDKRLHHQKFICAFNTSTAEALPYYIYIGSANLSQSAWGALEVDKRGNDETSDMKLVKITNFECGVMIPGHLLPSLLESGTSDWQAGVVPHVRPLQPYDLRKDKPWNDPKWAKGYDGSREPQFDEKDYGLNADVLRRLGR